MTKLMVAKIPENNFQSFHMERKEKLMEMLLKTPDDSFLQHALALEYIKAKELEKALETFEKLLEKDPKYIGSYYHLGGLYELKNDTDAAIRTYKTGIEWCRKQNEIRSMNELKAALNNLVEEEE